MICGCSYDNITVEYRYSNEELDQMEALVNKECKGYFNEVSHNEQAKSELIRKNSSQDRKQKDEQFG